MERYVDTHCHLLPDVDDGAQNIEEMRQMLQIAYDDGIRLIIATPHHHPRRGKETPQILRKQLKLVREEAAKFSDKLRVYLGSEVYFGQDVPEQLKEGKILSMNGSRYVLVEFSPIDSFEYICQAIRQIQMAGFEVIIAHVERYRCLREDVRRAEHLADRGVRLQVNADSIVGKSGWKIKRFIKRLMDFNLVFCVGTDAHNACSRPPQMKKAAQYVKKKYGEEYMRRIFFGNPSVMLKKKRINISNSTG